MSQRGKVVGVVAGCTPVLSNEAGIARTIRLFSGSVR